MKEGNIKFSTDVVSMLYDIDLLEKKVRVLKRRLHDESEDSVIYCPHCDAHVGSLRFIKLNKIMEFDEDSVWDYHFDHYEVQCDICHKFYIIKLPDGITEQSFFKVKEIVI